MDEVTTRVDWRQRLTVGAIGALLVSFGILILSLGSFSITREAEVSGAGIVVLAAMAVGAMAAGVLVSRTGTTSLACQEAEQEGLRLWFSAIGLGIAFDYLFWGKAPGVSFAIFVAACLLTGYSLLRARGHRPNRASLPLLAPIAVFSILFFVRLEPMTMFLSFMATLSSLALFAVAYRRDSWYRYDGIKYFFGFFGLAFATITRPYGSLLNAIEGHRQTEAGDSRFDTVAPYLRGFLFALPLLAVFAALLYSADMIFAQRLDGILSTLSIERVPEYITRSIVMLTAAYFIVGIMLHAASRRSIEQPVLERPLVRFTLGNTETNIILASIGSLFTAFVLVQLQYFFGGQDSIDLNGYTYAEYARRGFGELVAVALISLVVILGLRAINRHQDHRQHWIFTLLSSALVALVLVMLASAFQRMFLYEEAYGFSRLRTYTHVFMVWLGLLMAGVAILSALRRQRQFILMAIVAALGFAASLSLLNVDAFIAGRNVARAAGGEELDQAYLQSLSRDAIPSLVTAYESGTLDASLNEELGATIACLAAGENSSRSAWQSFNVSQWRAERSLDAFDDLGRYRVRHEKVKGPSGKEYGCNSS